MEMDGGALNPLFDLQLRVARRADEIAREARQAGALNLHCWLVAEMEVMGRSAGSALSAATGIKSGNALPAPF